MYQSLTQNYQQIFQSSLKFDCMVSIKKKVTKFSNFPILPIVIWTLIHSFKNSMSITFKGTEIINTRHASFSVS